MNRLGVSIVGLGSIAEYHLRSFKKLQDVRLRAVMSRKAQSRARAMAEYGVEIEFDNYRDLLEDDGTEAVVICTPNDLHFEMAKLAMEAGKHVLVEKPLASSLSEARELCHAARENDRQLMVAMTARFTPQYLEAFRLLRAGRIGDVIQIVVRWLEPKTIGINWEGKPVGVDQITSTVLYHHGSHMLDAALWLVNDKIDRIFAVGSRRQALNDDVAVLIRTQTGRIITAVDSFNSSQKIHDMTIIGTEGVIEIIAYEKLRINGQTIISTTWQEGLLERGVDAQSEEFARSIREHRPAIASGQEVLVSLEALEEAYSQLRRQGVT